MNDKNIYEDFIDKEDEIYKSLNVSVPSGRSTGNVSIDEGIDWLSQGSRSIFDFGCGNGSMLFYCALRGAEELYGMDLSSEGIKLAENRAELMKCGEYEFHVGTVCDMKKMDGGIFDGAVLSNILDNMMPEDAVDALESIKRLVRDNGKVLIKLNPYITEQQAAEYNMKEIRKGVFDDGLLLWNQSTDEWRKLLSRYFTEERYIDVYFPEYDQHNRMFLMRNYKREQI